MHRPCGVGHRFLLHGDRLARDCRLINGGHSGDHEPVRGDAGVRTDDNDVSDHELLHRYFHGFGFAAAHQGAAGGELGEGLDGLAGTAKGVLFERVAEAEQKQQHRTLRPPADESGADRGDEHEEVDLELPSQRGGDSGADGEEPTEEVGGEEERQRPSDHRQPQRELRDHPTGVSDAGGDREPQLPACGTVGMILGMSGRRCRWQGCGGSVRGSTVAGVRVMIVLAHACSLTGKTPY